MNNLLSYCGLVDASASEKDLLVKVMYLGYFVVCMKIYFGNNNSVMLKLAFFSSKTYKEQDLITKK